MGAHRPCEETLSEFKSIRIERVYRLLVALVIKTDPYAMVGILAQFG